MTDSQADQAPVSESTPAESTPAESSKPDRQPLALELVKRHVIYAAAVGLVPIPIVNAAGVAGVAVKLLRDLGKIYDVPFRQDRIKSIASALVGGALSTELGVGAAGVLKGWPLVGGALSVAAVPAFAGATVYAIGKVFIQHFESGGTFLDFDPEKVKQYFKDQFQRAKTAVA
ncbi:MAG TPA: DUF697 domain-containing protein [Vicinamibacterales bacterium]